VWKNSEPGETAEPPESGDEIGGFRLESELGRGVTGIVFRAHGAQDPQPVALKVARFTSGSNWKLNTRFRQEAEILAGLDHPQIVRYINHGVDGRRQFLAMELLAGPSLQQVLGGGPLPVSLAVPLALQLGRAVCYLHRKFILHRDLQASNILFDGERSVRIIDFSLALPQLGDADLSSLNRIIGPRNCLPPESAAAARSDLGPECDLYALGGVIYHMLCGRPPFPQERSENPCSSATGQAVPVRQVRPEVPRDLEAVVMRCLAPSPLDRFAVGEELCDELRRIERRTPVDSHHYTLWERLSLGMSRWRTRSSSR
ncbi:MAG: serine/threonine protein kinase, partial [Planctomycetaceae bacterium]